MIYNSLKKIPFEWKLSFSVLLIFIIPLIYGYSISSGSYSQRIEGACWAALPVSVLALPAFLVLYPLFFLAHISRINHEILNTIAGPIFLVTHFFTWYLIGLKIKKK